MLKVKVKPKQKNNDDKDDGAKSNYDSDSEEKKIKKYWSKAHKDNEESTKKEIQMNHNNFLKIQLKNEACLFRSLLEKEKMFEDDCISTRRFWLKCSSTLPYLFKLTKLLLNIQASTAFVERFFSICGIICSEKNSNMKDENFVVRSILKANMQIL
jgi:hypothetical protein